MSDDNETANHYPRVSKLIFDEPWAILPSKLEAIVEAIQIKAAGGNIDYQAAQRAPVSAAGSIAVIPIRGVISHRAGMFTEASGGTSIESLSKEFRQSIADPDIGAILFDIHSPGGSVYGLQELADEINAARGTKPVIASVNASAASAAYWLASQADEIHLTASGDVGSIGVIAAHEDRSAQNERDGIKVTYITAGRFKAEGNPDAPLDESAAAFMQRRVDEYYSEFVNAVARGRRIDASQVVNDFGEGRIVGAKEAARVGMVDKIATFHESVADLQSRLAARKPGVMARNRARVASNRF